MCWLEFGAFIEKLDARFGVQRFTRVFSVRAYCKVCDTRDEEKERAEMRKEGSGKSDEKPVSIGV